MKPTDNPNYKQQLDAYLAQGYTVDHMDGSGVHLSAPKKIRLQTKIGYAVGLAILYFLPILGVIILACAFVDQAMTKPGKVYVSQ